MSGSYVNDKYPGSCLCLLQHWNREFYTIMLTVGVIISEHPTSGVALKLFRPAKSKRIHQDWTIVVGIMRLVTGLSEGNLLLFSSSSPSLRYGVIYDHLLSLLIYNPVNMVNMVNKGKQG